MNKTKTAVKLRKLDGFINAAEYGLSSPVQFSYWASYLDDAQRRAKTTVVVVSCNGAETLVVPVLGGKRLMAVELSGSTGEAISHKEALKRLGYDLE